MSKFAVVIPAAGKAERFGGAEKKTFAKLDGRPVFLRSIELFINREDVCQTILAVAPEDMEQVKTKYGANLGFMGVTLVEGGEERVDTIAAALEKVAEDAEYIAIHDAARPCATSDMIDAVFSEARKSGAAILAAPLNGTIKRVSDSKVIDETVPRAGMYEAQTPQVFKVQLFKDAMSRRGEIDSEITDEALLFEKLGETVSVVECDHTNLKITNKADMTLANAIIKSRPAKKVKAMGAFEEAQW